MPPTIWLAACVYLVVGAASLLEAEIITDRAGASAAAEICLAALAFAAAWPLRAIVRTFHRLR